jgi:hypothetical protein
MLSAPSISYLGTGAAAPAGPAFSNVKLLIGADGANNSTSFTDDSAAHRTLTVGGNAKVTTINPKFGTGCLLLDGSGDYLSLAPSSGVWSPGAGQATGELWARFAATGSLSAALMGQWGASTSECSWFFYLSAGTLRLRFYDNTLTVRDCDAAWAVPDTNWHHLAWDRDGSGVVRTYVDGVMKGKTTLAQTMNNATGQFGVGTIPSVGLDLNGALDEIRVTVGEAVYATDAGFTPPTAAFARS